jgi:YidC/Oxa1 family membrane protein insertase
VKELSPEYRTLLAFALSMVILLVWGLLYKPQPPPKKPQAPAAATPATSQPSAPVAASAAPTPQATAPKSASQEKTVVIESDLYRIELSNRGAVVRSWQLQKYTDDSKPPRILDVVHPPASGQTQQWPFSLLLDDKQLEAQANGSLYEVTAALLQAQTSRGVREVTPPGGPLHPPASLTFTWSDGHLAVTKRLKFSDSYAVELETSVLLDGKPIPQAVAWRGGFGDPTAYQAAQQVLVFYRAGGKLETLPAKKLGLSGHPDQPRREAAPADFAGIEDGYFAAAFLPNQPGLQVWNWLTERDTVEEGKTVKEPVPEMAAGSTDAAPLDLRVYVGPKDFNDLGKLTPPLRELVQFGWFGFIAEPLFYILKWIYNYVPNYGWAIIVLTLGINMALFPLKVKSWRSMQKMQKVMPEIKSIQNKYSKYSMRDPRKQEMNKEVMAVYQREGINPMGGCLPMVLQMPIWIALYRMLGVAIELRHAPWLGWVRDLSAHDPYYILPVLMTVTMYVMQKMTPATTADPAQQKMMNFMPLFFGFLFFRVSSGLVLYILTSNIIGMGQQWYLNRTAPAAAPAAGYRNKKRR